MRIEDYEEAPTSVPMREKNMRLAATRTRYQLGEVEHATKIQFPDDEICNHDNRTGKYQKNILGGAINEDDDHLSGSEEEQENHEEDLDALAKGQEEEAEPLASLATANRKLRDVREKQHQVRNRVVTTSATGTT